jgi:uncharacterized repeat protein (TIGR01451 family)
VGAGVEIVSCTVVDNEALRNASGGGLHSAAGQGESPVIRNSIFAGNRGTWDLVGPDICANVPGVCGDVSSADFNLIEDPSGATLTGSTSNNVTGEAPVLGELLDNGGDTQTHALQPGSPAVDTGSCTDIAGDPVASDQRGVARPQGIWCDIGAYESQSDLALIKAVDDVLPQPGQRIIYTVTVENSGATDATGGFISDTLPVGLTLAGPIVLDPPTAGVVGTPPILVTDLTVPSGGEVRVSFPVTVSYDLPVGTVITNTASVTSSEAVASATGMRTIVVRSDLFEMFLPLVAAASP